MANINDGDILRFEHGGEIIITPESGTAATVLNIKAGTVNLVPTMFATLPPDIDRGIPRTDIRKGDKQPGTLNFDACFQSDVAATELYELLTADTGDQNKKKHTIVINWYSNDTKTIGRSITISNAVVASPPTITAGTEMDQINASFISPSDFVNAAIAP